MALRVARVALLVGLGASVLWLATFGSFEQEVRQSVAGGHPMPDFRLPILNEALLNGDTVFFDAGELDGKVALVAWWATWCRPCLAEQPSLLALQDEFGEDGLVVLGVLHEDSPERALTWLKENNRLHLKTVVGTPAFPRESHVGGLPNTVLVDRRGTVTELFLGHWPERDPYAREAVRRLIQKDGAAM